MSYRHEAANPRPERVVGDLAPASLVHHTSLVGDASEEVYSSCDEESMVLTPVSFLFDSRVILCIEYCCIYTSSQSFISK